MRSLILLIDMPIPLKCIEVPDDVFENILKTMASRIVTVPSVNPYSSGYSDDMSKKIIVYDGLEYLIIQEYVLLSFMDIPENVSLSDWKQVKVRRSVKGSSWEDSIDGPRATRYMNKLLLEYYSEEELEECYRLHESPYDARLIQIHSSISMPRKCVECYPGSVKYDINGAHQDALIEIFPKAESAIRILYDQRKQHPVYKKYVNYFVGNMCNHGHRLTYNWIVQRTTLKLKKAIDHVGGLLLYANTDGFIAFAPDRELPISSDLGGFKLEYMGDVCVFKSHNYTCIELSQCKDPDKRITGSIRIAVRTRVNLLKGIVVSYATVKTVARNSFGKSVEYREIKNIEVKEVPVHVYSKEDILH